MAKQMQSSRRLEGFFKNLELSSITHFREPLKIEFDHELAL